MKNKYDKINNSRGQIEIFSKLTCESVLRKWNSKAFVEVDQGALTLAEENLNEGDNMTSLTMIEIWSNDEIDDDDDDDGNITIKITFQKLHGLLFCEAFAKLTGRFDLEPSGLSCTTQWHS